MYIEIKSKKIRWKLTLTMAQSVGSLESLMILMSSPTVMLLVLRGVRNTNWFFLSSLA